MTQFLSPLFGEFSTDLAIARASAHRAGVIAKPTFTSPSTGAGATLRRSLVLGVDSSLGFFAWKTPWDKANGSFLVLEDGPVSFASNLQEPPAGQGRHYLLVGRWKWIPGPVGGNGIALGTFTTAQHAVYEAIAGSNAVSPVDPGVPATDAAGRSAVVLARVVWMSGAAPVIEWLPETMLDLAEMGRLIDGKHNRNGDERHVGKFKVSEAPTDDEDVLRRIDVKEGAAKPYANIAHFSASLSATHFPYAAGNNPARLNTARISGINVEALSTGGWRAKAKGLYRIDYSARQWGSPGHGYIYTTLAVKSASNAAAGFAPVVQNERSFFGNGTAEAIIPLSYVLELEENDVIGLFVQTEGQSTMRVYVTIEALGERSPTDVISIITGNQSWMASNGQVFPKIVNVTLATSNAIGAVVWTIAGGTAAGFSTINGNSLTVNFPSVGDFSILMRATDSSGNIAEKNIALNLAAFQIIPVVITTGNQSFEVDNYPFVTSILLSSTGGELPITWSIVSGANTTLPAPSIVSGRLSSSLPNQGTWTVEVRATDSAGTPQVVSKILTIQAFDYIEPPPDDPCFEEDETFVLMGDGTAKLLKDVVPGEYVAHVNERGHLRGHSTILPGLVTDKTSVPAEEGDAPGVIIDGVKSTPGHAYGVPRDFRRAAELLVDDEVIEARGDHTVSARIAHAVAMDTPLNTRANLGVQGGTYFVGATQSGPFRLVHNATVLHPCY